jgi:hypothetical protein
MDLHQAWKFWGPNEVKRCECCNQRLTCTVVIKYMYGIRTLTGEDNENKENTRTRCNTLFLILCNLHEVTFQVLTSMETTVFWDIEPCSLAEFYGRFRGAYCLHHQGDESSTLPDYTAQQPRRQPTS